MPTRSALQMRPLMFATFALLGIYDSAPERVSAQVATSADARLTEAIDWYTGVSGRVDDDRARALLLDAAGATADPITQMWIARVYSRGRMGFDNDPERARTLAASLIDQIRERAADGDVEATFLMGTAYDEGLGVSLDPTEAARWYRRAAEKNHVLGAHNLGNVYRDGRGIDRSDAAAVVWWLRAARAGDAITQLRLGEAFEAGRGVPAGLDQAITWYRRAAERGNAQAAENLERLLSR